MKKTGLFIKLIIFALVLSLLLGLMMLTTIATNDQSPTLSIYAQTLELEQSVYINYYVKVDGVADLSEVELQIWTDKNGENAVNPVNTPTPTAILAPISTEATLADDINNTYVKFSYRDLAAKQMTDTVYARAHIRVAGIDYYSAVQKYSVLQYAYNKLGLTDAVPSENPALHMMLQNMLAYGASAQSYFDYATNRLATDTFCQISVVGGEFEDGCVDGLYRMGDSILLTATAPAEGNCSFIGWMNADGFISNEVKLTAVVEQNTTYVAVWASKEPVIVNQGEMVLNENITVMGNDTDAVIANGGTVIIEGGYYNGGQTPFGGAGNTAVWANGGDVIIHNGFFTVGGLAEGDVGHIDLIYAKLGTVTINGGFFVGADDTVWLLNCHDANYANGKTNIVVTGGTFVNFNPANNASEGANTSFVAEGYTVIPSVQKNGDIWYTVVSDAEIGNGVEVNEGEMTLKDIIVASDAITDAVTANGGTVIIEGGYYNGGQTPFGGAGNTAVWANGGDVIIHNGFFTVGGLAEGDVGHIDLIYAKLGTVTINGGFFVGADDTVWLLNCHDANYANGKTNIVVTGGTFVNFNPANNASEGANTSFVAEGYTVIPSVQKNGDIWYTVVSDAEIGNGVEVNEGEMTLKDIIVASDAITDAVTANGGTVIIEGGYYNGGQTPFGGAGNTAVWANGGDVIIHNGFFTVGGLAEGDVGHIDLIYAKLGTVTINGGFFVGADDTVWLLNCHDANYANGKTNIVVTGGTFVNFNPANNASEGANTSFVAEGYTVIPSVQKNGDIWYTVVAQ